MIMDPDQEAKDIEKARLYLMVALSLAHVERAAQQVDMELAKETALLGLKFGKKAADLLPAKDRAKAQLEYLQAEKEALDVYRPKILDA